MELIWIRGKICLSQQNIQDKKGSVYVNKPKSLVSIKFPSSQYGNLWHESNLRQKSISSSWKILQLMKVAF